MRASRTMIASGKNVSGTRELATTGFASTSDALARDPGRPSHIKAEYNCGDNLHPNGAAYEAMAARSISIC